MRLSVLGCRDETLPVANKPKCGHDRPLPHGGGTTRVQKHHAYYCPPPRLFHWPPSKIMAQQLLSLGNGSMSMIRYLAVAGAGKQRPGGTPYGHSCHYWIFYQELGTGRSQNWLLWLLPTLNEESRATTPRPPRPTCPTPPPWTPCPQ